MASGGAVSQHELARLGCCEHVARGERRGERRVGWGGTGVRCDENLGMVTIVMVMIVMVMTLGYAEETWVVISFAAAATHHSRYPDAEE